MEYLLVKYAHVLCLVYWLGGDLGTFIASRFLIKESLGAEARVVAARILILCDQGPRFAMPLILPTGLHMAWLTQILPVSGTVMAIFWAIALLWLGLVIALHVCHGPASRLLTGMDWTLRSAICLAALTAGFGTVFFGEPLRADWAGYKLGLFGLTVLMGLMIRVKLKPFFGVFGNLVKNTVDAHTNAVIRRSLGGSVPFVMAIWVLLLTISAFGIHLLPLR